MFGAYSLGARLLAVCLGGSAALLPTAALGQEPSQADIVVRYSGPLDCSSASDFIQRAAPRLPSLRLVEAGGDVGLEVKLAQRSDGVSAELVIHLEEGGTLSRSILASSCDEATEAIAFVASVALDPGAQKPVVVQSAGPPDGEEQEEGAQRATDDATSAEDAESAEQARAAEREQRRRRRRRRADQADSRGLLGVGAALGFGIGPEALVGPDLSLSWASQRPGMWSPALGVRAQYLLLEGYEQPAGVASLHLGRLGLELCPSSFRAGILSGRPCVGLAGGWVQSQGSDTVDAGQAMRPWFDTNLSGQLLLALGRQSALILNGYVGIPWIRDSYQFDMTVFHRTPAVAFGLGLSIGARLW